MTSTDDSFLDFPGESEDGGDGTDGPANRADDSEESMDAGYLVERAITGASVLLVTLLLGYLLWQAVVTPEEAKPTATIESVEPVSGDGGGGDAIRATVALRNEGGTGLTSVAVTVRCGGSERTLEFSRVPAQGQRTGTVVCPPNSEPRATVTAWVTAGS